MNTKTALSLGKIEQLSDEGFFNLKKAGIDAVELSVLNPEPLSKLNPKEVIKNAEKNGVELWSFHVTFEPFGKIDPSLKSGEIAEYTKKAVEEGLNLAGECGVKCAVIHPSCEPYRDGEREERIKIAKENLALYANLAEKNGVTLCVEDLPRTCLGHTSDEILQLISADSRLRVCFDTNHLLFGETQEDFIKAVGDKIVTLHVSDYDFLNERHWLPGEGDINWEKTIKTLDEIGYNGPLLYEVSMAPPTIVRPHVMTYEDIAENMKELMNGKTPAPLGTRVPDLKKWK